MGQERIPIANIFYMLLYAWNRLDLKDEVPTGCADETTLLSLFCRVFLHQLRIQHMRGLPLTYNGVEDIVPGVKGRLMIEETIGRGFYRKAITVCRLDEFSRNSIFNQILRATAMKLIRTSQVDSSYARELRAVVGALSDVNEISLSENTFMSLRYNKLTFRLKTLMSLSELIWRQLLPIERAGNFSFSSFLRDERQMARVFEDFIRGFYKIEVPVSYKAGREYLDWGASSATSEAANYLPRLETDVSIRSMDDYLIIETKYTPHAITGNFDVAKISRAHLSQLLLYLQSAKKKTGHSPRGILLYPSAGNSFRFEYPDLHGHHITVMTINLDQNWQSIHQDLLQLIQPEKAAL